MSPLVAALLPGLLAARSSAGESGAMHAGHAAAAVGGFESDMNAGMAQMMNDMHRPGYSGDPDIDFLAMMIPRSRPSLRRPSDRKRPPPGKPEA